MNRLFLLTAAFLAAPMLATNAATAQVDTATAADRAERRATDGEAEYARDIPAPPALLGTAIGHAPPEFNDDLQWHGWDRVLPGASGGDEPCWDVFRDRIVVVQTWSSANERSLRTLQDAIRQVSKFSMVDVQLIALHTPDGAENAKEAAEDFISDQTVVLVDPTGEWSDRLGLPIEPVNFIIDRNGEVRTANQQAYFIEKTIRSLLDEPYEWSKRAEPLPALSDRIGGNFPTFRNSTGRTRDIRGQRAPDPQFGDRWVTPMPEIQNRVVMVKFWTTSCPHCINAIPKMNEIAEKYRDRLAVIAISNEREDRFDQGMRSRRLSAESFQYGVNLDPGGRLARRIGVSGVPHAIIVSSDGVVRWQGHPASLTESALDEIIKADFARRAAREDLGRPRWVQRVQQNN